MSIARSVADVLRDHVVLEYEAIDRMYLNVYVPHLQTVGAMVGYLRVHRGQRFASTTAVAPMTEAFVCNIEQFVAAEGVDLIAFEKGQRKDDVTQKYLREFRKSEGVLYVGKAQEKARVMRTERRRCSRTGATYPWIVQSTAMVNHYYFYGVDEDFGPFFLKFCSYFPYNAKLCINGHEYLKRQLAKRGVAFEALDNGIKSCANPKLLQRLSDELTAEKIDRLLRKWLRRLPHPFPPRDRASGYRYQLSILQAEFSLTQVLDQPVTGRIFFEEVIRENLDIGRPSQVSLIFDRKLTRRTPGRFRTRVITDGVVPSLHIDYKKSRIKQYHKLLDGASNRNDDQRYARLWYRPTHREPCGTAQDRLCGQPTSARRPTHRPRLLHRRSRVPGHAKASNGRGAARGSASLRRPTCARPFASPAVVPPRPGHLQE